MIIISATIGNLNSMRNIGHIASSVMTDRCQYRLVSLVSGWSTLVSHMMHTLIDNSTKSNM